MTVAMSRRYGRRAGAAAFALGLALAAPVTGVAWADGDAGPSDPAANAEAAPNHTRAAKSSAKSSARSSAKSAGAARAGQRPAPPAAAATAPRRTLPVAAAVNAVAPAADSGVPAADPGVPKQATPARSAARAGRAALRPPIAAFEPSPLTYTGAATSPAPVTAAAAPAARALCPRCSSLGAVDFGHTAAKAIIAIGRLLDSVDTLLAGLPANPITDLLSGAWLMVRRTLFPTAVASANKPGLISSDYLTVNKETGELADGDEPVMLTVVMTTTMGVKGSTLTKVVDNYPNEIGNDVTAGETIGIPNTDGDVWIDYRKGFNPLNLEQLAQAIVKKSAVQIPVVLSVTLMLEGDSTPSSVIGAFGADIASRMWQAGRILENLEITVPDITDPKEKWDAVKQVLAKAQDDLMKVVKEWTTLDIIGLALTRWKQWVLSAYDPDDPVGLSATALIPMEPESAANLVDLVDPRGYCFARDCTVSGVWISSGGTGYDFADPPTVKFVGGLAEGGRAATGEVSISDFDEREFDARVIGIRITDPGEGYYAAPKVVLEGGVGSGAEATATLKGTFLDDQFMSTSTFELRKDTTKVWDTDIALRYGFLMPGGVLPNGKTQSWSTTYAGDYVDNDWAEWVVKTEAWPRISW